MTGQAGMRRDISGWMVRWDAARAARLKAEGAWLDKTIADHLDEIVAATPRKVLVTDGARDVTAQALQRRARRLAQALVQRGYRPGDTLSFQLPNWVEAVEINLAAAMAGLVVNPIVPIYRGSEVGFMLADSRARLIFIPGTYRKHDYREMMAALQPGLREDFEVVVVRDEAAGHGAYETLLAEGRDDTPLPGADPDAVKMIMYTSGTTGRAKGVLHSHNTLQAENLCRLTHLALTPDDIMFNPSPVTHVTGTLYSLCIPFTCGVRTVMLDTWEPERAFDMMRDNRVTGIVAATIFLQGLVDTAKARGETLPDLRFFLCGGAQVPPELIREAARIFPNCVPSRIYGATEVPCITAGVNRRSDLDLGAETDGRIWRAEARLVDAVSGAPVAPGEEGEIIANAPQMLLGYAHAEDNEGAFDAEGFFHMGDLGRLVDGKYITVTGRKKDLIIRAGENLSPKEVEDILYNHPAIADISIVAMPDDRTGEKAAAFVIPAPGQEVTLESMAEFLIAFGTARQKIPEWLELVEAFPRTSVGKVRKDLLRNRAREIFEARKAGVT